MPKVPGVGKLVRSCLAAAMLGACAIAPPVQEMSDARQAIAAAEGALADRYAPDEIREARRFIAEAEADIAEETYAAARSKALRAQDRAVRALQIARAATDGE
jgi:hypothetical protein